MDGYTEIKIERELAEELLSKAAEEALTKYFRKE